ncbi:MULTISPECIES: hypothetical protein [Microvirga]|uniref:Uncharacterized protein n=1 Tax=Microvirga mediterraneensis TaxID=2754695 RepID=A0A838BU63_9HYPH|nr:MULTISPECIES: hypothetical protein [Microvirga]MBA1158453.1 hypothetical protein [Microvirga mediterraneensis]
MIDDDDIPLFTMPDFDDTLRRLSDVFLMHRICRRRACQKNESCQGGFGPPCYLQRRHLFADALLYELDEYRAFWRDQRQRAMREPSWIRR